MTAVTAKVGTLHQNGQCCYSTGGYLLVLIGCNSHELCLWEYVSAEAITLPLLQCQRLFIVGFYYVYSRLIFMHGVQNDLEKK